MEDAPVVRTPYTVVRKQAEISYGPTGGCLAINHGDLWHRAAHRPYPHGHIRRHHAPEQDRLPHVRLSPFPPQTARLHEDLCLDPLFVIWLTPYLPVY